MKVKVISGFVLPGGKKAKPKSTVDVDEKFARELERRGLIEPVKESK